MTVLEAKPLEWEVANGGDSHWAIVNGKHLVEIEREIAGARWIVLFSFPYVYLDRPPFDSLEEAKEEAQRQLDLFVQSIVEEVEA
jgi:hypothetical protein